MNIKTFLFSAGLMALTAQTAWAGGYQLNDYSVTGLGRSFAGVGVVGDDYSAIAYNPAGMTLMKRNGMQAGLTMVNLKSDIEGVDSAAGKKDKMDYYAPIPNFFGQYNLTDKLSVGLGVYAPFGLKTDYKSTWFASDDAILSKLDIIDIAPAVAYKVTDKWSVGATFIARYIYGHMTNSLSPYVGGGKSDFELDGWTVSGVLGTMYEFTPDTRVGFSWRLRSTQQVKGDHEIYENAMFNQVGTGWASPALPETFTLSAFHKYKQFGFSGTARWTHWSQSFPEFTMKSDTNLFSLLGGRKTSVYNYDNSWTLTAGVDYYHNKNWTFRAGTGWDESPAHNNTNRTIRIPDNDRFWLSAGLSYMTDNWQFDAGYSHMFGRTAKALEAGATPVKYKHLRSNIFGGQVQYKF